MILNEIIEEEDEEKSNQKKENNNNCHNSKKINNIEVIKDERDNMMVLLFSPLMVPNLIFAILFKQKHGLMKII